MSLSSVVPDESPRLNGLIVRLKKKGDSHRAAECPYVESPFPIIEEDLSPHPLHPCQMSDCYCLEIAVATVLSKTSAALFPRNSIRLRLNEPSLLAVETTALFSASFSSFIFVYVAFNTSCW